MSNYKELKNYKIFIEDYFNISYRWDELEFALDDFILCESHENCVELLKEIKYIQEEADWEYIREVNEKFGRIYYKVERNNQMLERIKKYMYEKFKLEV